MVLGWHCTKGPASATAPLHSMHTWTFWAEHWIFKQCRVYYTECSNSSSEYEKSAFLHTHWPTIHSHRGFSQREGGLGIGQNARGEVCVGLKTFEKSSVFFKEMDLYHHTPQWSSSNIACMYQPPACILCTTFFLHSGWLFNEHPGDKTASTRPLYSSHNLQKSSLLTSCNIYLWWRFFNVSPLCTNVSIPARGPRGPLPSDTKALISQTAEMEFNRIGKTGNVYDHIANIKKSTICESSSSTCSWHAYSH